MRASIAANSRWGRERDRSAATAAARAAFLDRFEKEVDPTGELEPALRAKLAANLRAAYFKRLALRSAKARRKAAGTTGASEAAS